MGNKRGGKHRKLGRKAYEKALYDLQVELCRLQAWVKATGERAVVVFEGRDAAGKGGVIKRITERVSPRVFRTVALPAPSEREKTQLYAQRYIQHFPAAGEIVLFDRSWYNRAGVERVMGFTEMEQVRRFLRSTTFFEREISETGIKLIKYFLHVDQDEQERRFLSRMTDPTKHWKLSPMDLESYRLWDEYSIAYDEMLRATHTPDTPWFIIDSNDKKRARLNCISHLLSQFDYQAIPFEAPELPERETVKDAPKDGPQHGIRIPTPF
ncbi:polyphosphate kinase 2 [Nisaea acidiphila]|uniref:ADP/GDP-polyphosphate phosphotransferase n=1 Tax=Nisaea acidiphila TaxID=1862145 RepID=A0A9J7AT47_9PROT|nr:polyphosphate kinase 2 [Nisaea acidiphila]UUX48541.1 polyphosphate kinase 2 [Nisaea acidiphila]